MRCENFSRRQLANREGQMASIGKIERALDQHIGIDIVLLALERSHLFDDFEQLIQADAPTDMESHLFMFLP